MTAPPIQSSKQRSALLDLDAGRYASYPPQSPSTAGITIDIELAPAPPTLPNADLLAFRRDGHVRLRAVYTVAQIERLDAALVDAHHVAERLANDADEQLARDAFLWRQSEAVAAFALDPILGALAAQLIGAKGIRLIHDVALDKSREHGPTPWHRDSDFWSFEGAGALTMWIPLQATSLNMSPLRYANRSHRERNRRPLHRLEKPLIPARFRVASSALDVGDVAVHHYQTLHGAPRNREARSRRAFAIHLIDANARFRTSTAAGHIEHARRCGWLQLADGDPFTDAIAPIIYRTPE